MSCYNIDITFWGEHCQIEGAQLANLRGLDTPPTLAIKGGRVTEFNGKSVGTISNRTLFINTYVLKKLFFSKHGFMTMESIQPHHL